MAAIIEKIKGYEIVEKLIAGLLKESRIDESCIADDFLNFCELYKNYKTKKYQKFELINFFDRLGPLEDPYPGVYNNLDILLDIVNDAVCYVVDQGLPPCDAYNFLLFFLSSVQLLTNENMDLPMPVALQNFQKIIVPKFCNSFSFARFSNLVQYVMKTIFQHIHLYQYILLHHQPADVLTLQLRVETPDSEVCSLSDSKWEKDFMKHKLLDELMDDHQKRLQEFEDSGESAIEQAKEKIRELYVSHNMCIPLQRKMIPRDKLSSILSSVVDTCVQPTIQTLLCKLQRQEEGLEFRIRKLECLSLLNHEKDSGSAKCCKTIPIQSRSSASKSDKKYSIVTS